MCVGERKRERERERNQWIWIDGWMNEWFGCCGWMRSHIIGDQTFEKKCDSIVCACNKTPGGDDKQTCQKVSLSHHVEAELQTPHPRSSVQIITSTD